MKRGTIVLTLFPFTDLKTVKRRPALIVSNDDLKTDDVIVAFISSQTSNIFNKTDFLLKDSDIHFKNSGLKVTSVFRMNKLLTIEKKLLTGELGSVSLDLMTILDEKLKYSLDIKQF
ncbi:MAG: type II toxin-antitoxin system PemK/MazF family toxin [Ignavibacteria bacterium]|nr:type II toxin-antitoxin system PemK/MazF family toxin [Ignavibacteria bacterium]